MGKQFKTRLLSLLLVFTILVGAVYIPNTDAFAATTPPGSTTAHWFGTPVRKGIDVARIDGEEAKIGALPEGVFAFPIPGTGGSAPIIDPLQEYVPIPTETYLSDMRMENIFAHTAEDLNTKMANIMFNGIEIRKDGSVISELKSRPGNAGLQKGDLMPSDHYLASLISKDSYYSSSSTDKAIMSGMRGLTTPQPHVNTEYDSQGMNNPVHHRDGFYYFGPVRPVASGYHKGADLGFLLSKFDTGGAGGATLVRMGSTDEEVQVNQTVIANGEELWIKISDTVSVPRVRMEFTYKTYERKAQVFKASQSNGMYLASPYFQEVSYKSETGFGEFGVKGSVRIKRYDDKGNELRGSKYTIKSLTAGSSFTEQTGITITDMEVVVSNLPAGDYEIFETEPPKGHKIVKTKQYFSIFQNEQIVDIAFRSSKFDVPVKTILEDADTGQRVSGGNSYINRLPDDPKELERQVASGNFVNGQWSARLPVGTYAGYPGMAPDGYYFIDYHNGEQFEITDENDNIEITLKVRKVQGRATITVKEWMKTRHVPNAIFELYKVTDKGDQRITKFGTITSGPNGVVDLTGLDVGQYYMIQKNFVGYSEYIPNVTPIYFNIYGTGYVNSNGQYVTEGTHYVYTHENKIKKGSVEVSVVDEEGTTISGVEFSLFKKEDPNNALLSRFTTTGRTAFFNLEPGDYFIKWTNELEMYRYDDTILEFTIKEDGDYISLTFPELKFKRGTVIARKMDAVTNEPIRDTWFVVVNMDGIEVGRIRTGDDGAATLSGLKIGNYLIQEVENNEKYNPNRAKTPFSITRDNQTVELIFKELIKVGDLVIRAQDVDGKPIQGARFSVYDMNNIKVSQGITDINGELHVTGLKFGKYLVYNESVDPKYQQVLVPQTFEIRNMGDRVRLIFVFQETHGTITIIKRDAITKKPLPYAEFSLYEYETGKKIMEAVSDRNGEATFKEVPYGRYYALETKAPPGYHINTTVIGGGHDMKEPSDGWPLDWEGIIPSMINTTRDTNRSQGGLWISEEIQRITIDQLGSTEQIKPPTPPEGEWGSFTGHFEAWGEDRSANGMLTVLLNDDTNEIVEFGMVEEETVVFTHLPYGNYMLQVVNYPARWNNRVPRIKFTVSRNSKDVVATVSQTGWDLDSNPLDPDEEESGNEPENANIGNIRVMLTNDWGQPISSSRFALSDRTGRVIDELETDSRGYLVFRGVNYGDYQVQQITTDYGLEINTDLYPVRIDAENKEVEIYLMNHPLPEGETASETDEDLFRLSGLLALDIDNNRKIGGDDLGVYGSAVELYNVYDELVDMTLTDQYGYYNFDDVVEGTYKIKFSLEEGYRFIDAKGKLTAGEDGIILVNVTEDMANLSALVATNEDGIVEDDDEYNLDDFEDVVKFEHSPMSEETTAMYYTVDGSIDYHTERELTVMENVVHYFKRED